MRQSGGVVKALIAFPIVCLTLATGCALRSGSVRGVFEQSQENHFRYSDKLLQLDIFISENNLKYEFRNLSYQSMEINHAETYWSLGDHRLTLWGDHTHRQQKRLATMPPIRVRPERFMIVSYPMLRRSPIWPFPVQENDLQLNITAVWGEAEKQYQIDLGQLTEPM